MKVVNIGQLITPVFFIIFTLVCLISPTGFDTVTYGNLKSAAIYPTALAVMLLVLSSIRVFIVLFGLTKDKSTGERYNKNLFYGVVGTIVGYIVGIMQLGFYITTIICMFLFYMQFERWNKEKIKKGLLFVIIITVVFLVLVRSLRLYLPRTWLF
jgi:hypothetical protein